MRWRLGAGVLLTLALLHPAAPAAAQAALPASQVTACQTVLLTDIRELITIDVDTASAQEVELVANQILAAARADGLPQLPGVIETQLKGTSDNLRAFLKTGLRRAWMVDLRRLAYGTLTTGGSHVREAASVALDTGTLDALFTYLNRGLFIARAADAGTLNVYRDLRDLVTIDLDNASDIQVELLARQIMAAAGADGLPQLPGVIQTQLSGTAEDLRAFLRTGLEQAWTVDLRVLIYRTATTGGPHVQAAAGDALAAGSVDALVTYLNEDLYVARALDC